MYCDVLKYIDLTEMIGIILNRNDRHYSNGNVRHYSGGNDRQYYLKTRLAIMFPSEIGNNVSDTSETHVFVKQKYFIRKLLSSLHRFLFLKIFTIRQVRHRL